MQMPTVQRQVQMIDHIIERLMVVNGFSVSRSQATLELIAEEWDVVDAIQNLRHYFSTQANK
jgi:hypothetical protein